MPFLPLSFSISFFLSAFPIVKPSTFVGLKGNGTDNDCGAGGEEIEKTNDGKGEEIVSSQR